MRRSLTLALALAVALVGVTLAGATAATASPTASAENTTLVYDGDELTLTNGPNQTIEGRTDLAPGTTIEGRLESTSSDSPFLIPFEATVSEDGTFEATVDLSSAEPGTEFDVILEHDGTTLLTESGTVAECSDGCDDATTTPEGSSDTTLVYEGETLTLEPRENRTIEGRTDLQPGTTIEGRLESTNSNSPFLLPFKATVQDDGTFEATVDLSSAEPGTEFDVILEHDGSTLLTDTGRIADCTENCADPTPTPDHPSNTTLAHEGEKLTLAAGPNQTLEGHTDLDPGTKLTVRIESDDPDNPFLRTDQVTVAEDGSFETTVDLDGMQPGTEFTVIVHRDGTTLHSETGTVVACDGDCATPTASNEAAGDGATLVYEGDQPTLADGPNQTLEGRTDLPAGSEVTIRLRSTDPENPFLNTETATVTENGTFAATFNLTWASPGTEFDVVVSRDGTTLLQTTGTVVDCADCTDSPGAATTPPSGIIQQSQSGQQGTILGGLVLLLSAVPAIGGLGFLLDIFRF